MKLLKIIRLCPYCLSESNAIVCCGEKHFERHYSTHCDNGEYVFVDPKTSEFFEEPCDKTLAIL